MRPLELTISAFGSYAGETTIPLKDLGKEGLYLITGPTGAGKSTIFDAIVYALYGQDKENKALRSLYAAPETATYVELIFEDAGKTYRIRRNPEYYRPKVRGEGFTKNTAAVELHIPGQEPITKADQVEAKISDEILGIDRTQFYQIAMIAQGEFRKLLQADTSKRQSIFRSLFHTEMYDRLQRRIAEDSKVADKEYATLNEKTLEIYEGVALEMERAKIHEDAIDQWKERTMDISGIEKAVELLASIIEEEAAASAKLAKEMESYDEKLTLLAEKERKIEEREEKASLIERESQNLEKQKALCENLKKQKEDALKKQPEIEERKQEVTLIKDQYEEYDRYDIALTKLLKEQESLAEAQELVDSLIIIGNDQEKTLTSFEEEVRQLKNIGEKLLKQEQKEKEVASSYEQVKDLEKKRKVWIAAQKEAEFARKALVTAKTKVDGQEQDLEKVRLEAKCLNDAEHLLLQCQHKQMEVDEAQKQLHQLMLKQEQYTEDFNEETLMRENCLGLYATYLEKKEDYDQKHQQYFKEQAGILAENLSEGMACPVCGSTHHPMLAQLSDHAVSKETVEEAKAGMEEADKQQADLSSQLNSLSGKVSEAKKNLENQAREVLEIHEFSEISIKILDKSKELSVRKTALAQEHTTLLERKNRYVSLNNEIIPDLEAKAKEASQTYQDQIEVESQCRQAEKNQREILDEAVNALFEVWTLDSLENQIKERQKALFSQQKTLQKEIEEAKGQKARKEDLEEHQIPELQKKIQGTKKQLQDTEKAIAQKSGSIEQQKTIIARQKEKLAYASKAEAEKQVAWKEEQILTMESDIQTAQKALEQAQGTLREREGELSQLKKDYEALPVYDKEVVSTEKETISNGKKERQQKKQSLDTAWTNHQTYYKELEEKIQKLLVANQKKQDLKELSDMANGSFNEKEKIKLETFVQTEYLDHIVRRANNRLYKMSGGQFTLKRYDQNDTKASKRVDHSLDLNVVDHHNNTVRSVNTLSGGEAFLASLALALGLSDEIAASAANVRMDTLFVDEGFGSLDEDTLHLAVHALQNLTEGGRLVGLISHVPELKNRIDRKVIVSKGKDGISNVEIECEL